MKRILIKDSYYWVLRPPTPSLGVYPDWEPMHWNGENFQTRGQSVEWWPNDLKAIGDRIEPNGAEKMGKRKIWAPLWWDAFRGKMKIDYANVTEDRFNAVSNSDGPPLAVTVLFSRNALNQRSAKRRKQES